MEYGSYPINPVNNDTISSENWISNAICYTYFDNNGSGNHYDSHSIPFYLGLSPNPSSNVHIKGLLDIINESWSNHLSDDDFIDLNNLSDPEHEENCNDFAPYIPFKEGWLLRYFDDDNDLNNYINSNSYGNKEFNHIPDGTVDINKPIGTAFSFQVNDDGTRWSWTLRGNISDLLQVTSTDGDSINHFERDWSTLYYGEGEGEYGGPSNYVNGPFLAIQTFIDNAITKYIAKLHNASDLVDGIDGINKSYGIMPVFKPETDEYWNGISSFLNIFIIFMICSFIYPFTQIVSQLLHEKEDKIKEGIKMMGVSSATYWTSWYLWLFIEMTVLALLIIIISVAMNVYKYSDGLLIFIWIWLFCINFTCLATLISTFFDNPKIASLFSFLLFIILMFATLYTQHLSENSKNALCLIGPCCFSMSTDSIVKYESSLIGIQWNNIYDSYNNFTFNTCLVMLFVDSIIYIVLTLYFDYVWPSRYGQRLHPLFFIKSTFWCPTNGRNNDIDDIFVSLQKQKSTSQYEKLHDKKYENIQPFISIRGLKKYFTNLFGKKGDAIKAVNGISLDLYKGEIFCLLGHNGAGILIYEFCE